MYVLETNKLRMHTTGVPTFKKIVAVPILCNAYQTKLECVHDKNRIKMYVPLKGANVKKSTVNCPKPGHTKSEIPGLVF